MRKIVRYLLVQILNGLPKITSLLLLIKMVILLILRMFKQKDKLILLRLVNTRLPTNILMPVVILSLRKSPLQQLLQKHLLMRKIVRYLLVQILNGLPKITSLLLLIKMVILLILRMFKQKDKLILLRLVNTRLPTNILMPVVILSLRKSPLQLLLLITNQSLLLVITLRFKLVILLIQILVCLPLIKKMVT